MDLTSEKKQTNKQKNTGSNEKKTRKLQRKRCSFAGELTIWRYGHELERAPTSLVCCMYTICFIFLFSQLNKDRSPWNPLDMSSSLQLSSTKGYTRAELLGENMLPLCPPSPCTRAPNRALGMCCNLAECQTAPLDWAFLEFSGVRPVREEARAPEGVDDIMREHGILLLRDSFHNNVDSSLLNQIDRVIRPHLLAVFQDYFHLLLIRFCLYMHISTHRERRPRGVSVGGHAPGLKGLRPIKSFLLLHFPSVSSGAWRWAGQPPQHSHLIFTIQMSADSLERTASSFSLANEDDWPVYYIKEQFITGKWCIHGGSTEKESRLRKRK